MSLRKKSESSPIAIALICIPRFLFRRALTFKVNTEKLNAHFGGKSGEATVLLACHETDVEGAKETVLPDRLPCRTDARITDENVVISAGVGVVKRPLRRLATDLSHEYVLHTPDRPRALIVDAKNGTLDDTRLDLAGAGSSGETDSPRDGSASRVPGDRNYRNCHDQP